MKTKTVIIGGIEYDRKEYLRGEKNIKPYKKPETTKKKTSKK